MYKLQTTYEQLLETIQEGILVYGADLYTTFVNSKMTEIIGYEESEIIGRKIFDFMNDEAMKNVKKKLERRKSGIPETYEEKLKHKDGHYVYVEIKSSPIINKAGNFNGGIIGITDISERHEAEKKVRESEARNRAILNAIPDLMFICDDKGVLLDHHTNNKSLLVVEPAQFLGKSVMEVLPVEVATKYMQGIKKAYETNQLQVFDYLLKVPEGLRHFEARIMSMDEQRYLAIVQEVTGRKKAEEEVKFQAEILDSIGDLVTATDPDGKIVYVNDAECRKFGRTKDELIGKTTGVYGENPEHGALQKEIVEATNEKGFWRGEVVNYDKDNNPIYLDCRTWAMRDADGFIHTLIGISSDITERKKAEEALRKSEQELKTITDNMTDVVSMADIEGRFTYLSKSNYQLTGYKPEELIGKSIFKLIHEDDIPSVGAIFQEGVIEGRREARYEYRVFNKSNHYIWVETIGSLVTDDNRNPSGALFVSRNISDRKQVEYELQEQKNLLNSVFQSIQDGISILNIDLTIREVNHAMEKWFEHQAPLIGKKCYEVYQNRSEPCMPCPSIKALEKKGVCSEIVPLMGEGKQVGWVELYAYPLIDEATGNINGVVEFVRDITERKQAEEKIRYLGFHDQLTDLYNRHYFERCKEELKDIPLLSVIMTDINGLKLINDTYGHETGDELLKKYAVLLRKSFKKSDLIFRWGGDEFIIILKNTQEAKSWELCNRLIKHCGETFVKDIPLSISVGISSKFQGGDIDKAIQEAEDEMYKNKLTESKSSKNLIMKTLLQTISEKSFETKGHIDRMTRICRQFGEKLSLSPSELSRLETLAMLHDVGKINIDSHILLKKTALIDEEWEEIKKHPEVGYRITRTTEEFAYVAEDILAHHERWDGNGYPQGLKGEDIPYLARLLNIIDSFDVMSNGRPYKKKMTHEEVIEEINRCSGKQFDPGLAERFIEFLKDGKLDLGNGE